MTVVPGIRVQDVQAWAQVQEDGIVGPGTLNACRMKLIEAGIKLKVLREWSDSRVMVAATQLFLFASGNDPGRVDGLVGPDTLDAIERRQIAERTVEGLLWPTRSQVESFYGPPGQNQVKITPPYDMVLAWDESVRLSHIRVHEKVADSVLRVLTRARDELGREKLVDLGLHKFGGSSRVRKMRGGSLLSLHSWGVAIDFDPGRNRLRWGSDRARLSAHDAVPWWEMWEEEGWTSLGRARDYDWMHVQAVTLSQ